MQLISSPIQHTSIIRSLYERLGLTVIFGCLILFLTGVNLVMLHCSENLLYTWKIHWSFDVYSMRSEIYILFQCWFCYFTKLVQYWYIGWYTNLNYLISSESIIKTNTNQYWTISSGIGPSWDQYLKPWGLDLESHTLVFP